MKAIITNFLKTKHSEDINNLCHKLIDIKGGKTFHTINDVYDQYYEIIFSDFDFEYYIINDNSDTVNIEEIMLNISNKLCEISVELIQVKLYELMHPLG